jgi:hypothetical protein
VSASASSVESAVRGAFRVLLLYEIADEIRLDTLRGIRGITESAKLVPQPTEGVLFERPPLAEPFEAVTAATGETLHGRIHYYDYGVVSVELELRFELTWTQLITQASYWLGAAELEGSVAEALRKRLQTAAAALIDPYREWLSEDYYIVQIFPLLSSSGQPMTGGELAAAHRQEITQIIRGETTPLSEAECKEVLESSISYYPSDLLVVGWTAALLYDAPERAAPTLHLLEYANTQLLEFRHYDRVLSGVLQNVRERLGKDRGFLTRWRLAREAGHLNTIRLEVIDLIERTDTAIKFLSDMFYARLYRIASVRVGVPDYRNLVDQKLRSAGEFYEFMVDQFQQFRAFLLEAAVVVILLIELVLFFPGIR